MYKTNKYNMPFLELIDMTPYNENFMFGYALMANEQLIVIIGY